ncbi:phenylalanine--tRNA ligase beta subunit [Fulvitalea axinellae]|uniref:Phenylalanine--tRNA ligase beta subunit n=1 Tax=Fulvitalea axinellae TaxID=1182444 RepID=A0AAU9DDY3_9BACT|nr:phenylalanine--tRNA ligase beta subunit [Fulvitalea axinellae]
MKISIDWLKEYISIDKTPDEISASLTATGLEVEGLEKFEQVQGSLEGLVLGEVLTCEKHPGADKLSKTTVDVGGEEPLPIVCGAPNVAAGQKVIVATVGATLYPEGHDPFKIKKAKIRGEVSTGMICAEDEIGLGQSHDGIMVLDTDKPNGTPAIELFDIKSDNVLEIGLTPNRADATSHFGVTRDLKAVYGVSTSLPSVDAFAVENTELPVEVIVENAEACPRYSGVTIKGVKVADSPEWLQFRLKSIGLAPINNIVDITNFVLHETGQPMHAFDMAEVAGSKIVVKNVAQDTPFVTLDGEERKLASTDLMICNESESMCIAGVFGGEKSGVKETTTDIFLESAYFSPDSVRKTSQRHGLKTDASFRFERGTDPNMTIYALKRAALLIKEIAGGEISSEIVDVYPNPIADFVVPVKYSNVDRLIGKSLGKELIKEILVNLDIKITEETEEGFVAIVPPYRVDVTREADVIEEILRIYGYDNIEVADHLSSDFLANFPVKDTYAKERETARLLADSGYFEVMTNSLTSSKYAEMVEEIDSSKNVDILNRLSEDLDVMRQSMVFNHLEVALRNINRRQKDVKIFEFGKTYRKAENGYEESARLGVLVTGMASGQSWLQKQQSVTYYDLMAVLNKIFVKFRIEGVQLEPLEHSAYVYGVQIKTRRGKVIGLAGLLNKKLCSSFGVKQEIYYADLDWELLLNLSDPKVRYAEIPKFPDVKRDLSLVIDKSVNFDTVLAVAKKNAGKLITDITVFDVYEGDKIDAGKKAYALNFTLQDKDKTLTDKVIDKTMNRLVKAFEREVGALIRQ